MNFERFRIERLPFYSRNCQTLGVHRQSRWFTCCLLDICCGAGSVTPSFAEKYPDASTIGYEFSSGMLHKAKQKDVTNRIILVQGDASRLSYIDDCFDVVCCSHALYELQGRARTDALKEMKLVVNLDGQVYVMEREVPRNPLVKTLVKIMFHMRMLMMGSTDSREFLRQDLSPFKKIFANVTLSHTIRKKQTYHLP